MLSRLAAFGAGLVGVFTGSVLAQPAEQKPFVEIRFAGLDEIDVAEKDKHVAEAFRLAGERLRELPEEMDGDDEAGPLIYQAWYAILGGFGFEVVPKAGPPGVALAITSAPAAPGSARTLLEIVGELAEMEGAPVQMGDDELMMPTPMGPVVVTADDRIELKFGAEAPATTEVSTSLLPRGAKGVFSFSADLRSINAMVGPMIAMQGPEAAAAMELSGWMGPDAPSSLSFEVGTTRSHLHWASSMGDARTAMANWGLVPEASIGRRELEMVPEDATRVVAMGYSLSGVLSILDRVMAMAGEDEDPWSQIQEMTGIDLRADVLENFGPRFVFYQSDTSGGGGMLSSVVLVELKDPEALVGAHGQAIEMLNGLAAEEAEGYVRVRSWEIDGRPVFTMTTPGIPLPLELSWTVHENMFVAAASPSGLSAALDQLEQPRGSVLQNEKFRSAVGDRMPADGAVAVVFSDAERFARQGYGPLNLLVSGLANGVRSPSDPDRQVGVLMPTFTEFANDIKPYGAITMMRGDDLISEATADRSMLVHAAGMIATFGGGQGAIAGTAMAGGVMLPALGRARESAKELKSATQVRGVVQGAILHAQNHGDRYPESIDVLIEEGFVPSELLVSPFGPAWDGEGDIVLLTGIEASFRADQIVAMDRAMYVNDHGDVNVGFADGHVETMPTWELMELLDEPQNEGLREAFGIGDDW